MRRMILQMVLPVSLLGLVATVATADSTPITAGLNAPVIGTTGGAQVYWGPVVSQTSLEMSGNTNTEHPQKYAGSFITGSGGPAGSRQYCVNSGVPASGPGTLIPPSTVPVYEWFCNYPAPPAPQVDFDAYKLLAQMQGNACAGMPCYNAAIDPGLSGINDPICTVNGHPKVWFFEGSPKFTGGTHFCGVLVSRGSVDFAGSGVGDITATPPIDAWQQYEVTTPNGSAGFGDTSAFDEYPGDAGSHAVKPYRFLLGGGGFNASDVTFQGYIYASTGYRATGNTVVVGAVQFGQGAASTSGGGTIFFQPQMIFSPPPPNTVNQPIITPPGGNFCGPVSVSIAVTTPGAEIFYTLDGSAPGETSTLYTSAFTLSANTQVKAIALKTGMNNSAVAGAFFTFTTNCNPPPVNQAPVANAGPDQVLTLPTNSTTLAGSGIDDGLPNPPGALTYNWAKVAGPGNVTFGNANAAATSASFSQSGIYVLRLTVSDNQLSDTDDVQITVQVAPPPGGDVCGDNQCTGSETCSTCAQDCGICPPPPAAQLQLDHSAYMVNEGAGSLQILVNRTGDTSSAVSVQYQTANGTAQAGADYTSTSGTLSFSAGQTQKSVSIPILQDILVEGNEAFTFSLLNPVGATLGSPTSATVTILDDDGIPPCGDGQCTGSETCGSCSQDCGICPPPPPPGGDVCGDGQCTGSETCSSCSQDCGVCPPPPPPPVIPPHLTSLVPNTAPAGFPNSFPLTVNGTGFDATSKVQWNGAPLQTQFDSATRLVGTVTPNLIASVGTADITVLNSPATGGLSDNSLPFSIRSGGSGTPPPFVVQQPHANPNPVNGGKTTQLSVLGGTFSNSGDESVLTYKWSVSGPAAVTVTPDNTNAAKNATALFSAPGTYTFQVRITDTITGFSANTDTLDVVVNPGVARVVVSPKTATLNLGQSFPFRADVYDQFNQPYKAPVIWSATAGNMQSNVFQAVNLSIGRVVTVTATTADGHNDSAQVTIIDALSGASPDLTNAKAFPVPYKATSGDPGITFGNLAPGTRIRLFSMEGRLVHTLESSAGNDVLWTLQNSSGDKVSSGVYFYILEAGDQKKEGKLVIIR